MTARLAIFTICSNNYLPFARVFFASAKARHPEADLFLCLADLPSATLAGSDAEWTTVPAAELGIAEFPALAFRYDIKEFNTALKPFMFLHLMEARAYDTVFYFDPDIHLYSRLDEELAALRNGASLSLTPHILQPLEEAQAPDDITIMRTGVYNLGFLGAARCDETLQLLHWWARRLRHQCLDAQQEGIFVDQKFMDLAPAFAPHCRISRHPGLNVAYWNLSQRHLTQANGTWLADGTALVFFHFSGFDPRRPGRLSTYTTRYRGDLGQALQSLVADYAQQLMQRGFGSERAMPYAYDNFASGTPIHAYVRRMFRQWTPDWDADPFQTYEAHLHQPWPEATGQTAGYVVTNFMAYLWDVVPGLKARFDLQRPQDVRDFVAWYVLRAAADLDLGDGMIQPVLRELEQHGIDIATQPLPGNVVDLPVTDNNRLLLEGLQRLRHRVAPAGSRREEFLRRIYQMVLNRIAARSAASRAAKTVRERGEQRVIVKNQL